MSTAAIVAGTAAAGLGGAALSASAAGNAASAQAGAANNSAELQFEAEQNALGFQENVWNQEQSNAAPWLQTGGSAELELSQLLGLPGASNGATPGNPFPGQPLTPAQQVRANLGLQRGISPGAPGGPPSNTLQMSNLTSPPGGTSPFAMTNRPMGGSSTGAINDGTGTLQVPGTGGGTAQPGRVGLTLNGGNPVSMPGGSPGGGSPQSGQLSPFTPWTQQFVAPTLAQAEQEPGYQFAVQQGEQALQSSAAAQGTLLDPNTERSLINYGQQAGEANYGNVYNRALGQYDQNYNIFENNQANEWNRLASLAGMGQTTAGQLNSAGQNASNTTSDILLGSARGIGEAGQNAAAATASGYVGGANAWSGALGNTSNTLTMAALLGQNGGGLPPYMDNSWMPSNPTPGQPYYPS